ncbi:MAG: hypothetical protein JWM48_1443 [Mycobacterium sp.]|nr:hypothetical protein [Mycobacterium sp.]
MVPRLASRWGGRSGAVVNMQQAMSSYFSQYASASGRARRSEYWWSTLAIGICIVVLEALAMGVSSAFGILLAILALATLLPGIAVGIRRLHDTDRSGWWLVFGIVPVVGGITLLVFMCLDGTPGSNRYGPSPKGVQGFGTGYYGQQPAQG